jgi:nickel superoxide dismutase
MENVINIRHMNIAQNVLSKLSALIPTGIAHAHCDVPCGIYDPHRAIIGALTVIRMIDIIEELAKTHPEQDVEFDHSMSRAVAVKEQHAEQVKHEVRTIWGDYFKPEHREKYPDLDNLVYEIMQAASKGKQTISREAGMDLLNKVNDFAEIFWETKGKETKRVKAPYKPEEEMVVPIL